MVTKTTFSERDFFDEIYEHAQESTQSDKEIKVTLSFARECKDLLERRQNVPRGDREIMFDAGGRYKDEWRYPPRMLAYMTFMHTFGRTSILRQGFAESDHALTLYVHPRKFVDFYRRRYGIEPSSTNQVTQRSTKIHIYIDSKIGIYTFRKDRQIRYPHITAESKIYKIISYLRDHGQSTTVTLARYAGQPPKSVKRGVEAFNKIARKRFGLHVDPIIGGDGVYELSSVYDFP